MATVTKFTEYPVRSPHFFIKFINEEMANRDIAGVTKADDGDSRLKGISCTGEHPMVQIVGSVLKSGKPNLAGLLPTISVIEDSENENDVMRLGQGRRMQQIVDQDAIDFLKGQTMEERLEFGIITDDQLELIQVELNKKANKKLFGMMTGYWQDVSLIISLWSHSTDERDMIGSLLRSIIYDMRVEMGRRDLKDVFISTQKGVTNFNFGQVLFGLEHIMTFKAFFHNIEVTDKEVVDNITINNIASYIPIGQPNQVYDSAKGTTGEDQ